MRDTLFINIRMREIVPVYLRIGIIIYRIQKKQALYLIAVFRSVHAQRDPVPYVSAAAW